MDDMHPPLDRTKARSGGRIVRRFATLIPSIDWMARYSPCWLLSDLIAGTTLAAYAIPVSLAYATLAGMPPQSGVYCYLIGGVAYAIFGTSRQLAVGPTSAIAMLVGTTVATMADGDAARWTAIGALTALITGFFGLLAWLFKLSGLVSFISETILVGFKAGAALAIAMTQLPKLFGVAGGGDHFFERTWILLGQLDETNGIVLTLGLTSLLLMLLGDWLLPGRPITVLVVGAATLVVSLGGLSQYGVAVVGTIPAGLPAIAWPSVRLRDVDGVLTLAAACFLLGYVESVSAARTLAQKNASKIDPRQELLALGAANVSVAFGHGFPIAGGLSQSAVNDNAGARTPLSLIAASAVMAVCLVLFTDLLHDLPTAALAAIVLVAVRGLVDLRALGHLWRASRFEFWIAMVALVGVLLVGVLKGVLLAAIVSLLGLVAAAAKPHVAFLTRIPGTNRLSDAERHPGNEDIPGMLIFRIESSLLYFNVEHVWKSLESKLSTMSGVSLVVCDLSNAPMIDVAGASMLRALHQGLKIRGATLRIVGAHAKVRHLLHTEILDIGNLTMSMEQVISDHEMGNNAPVTEKSR